MKFKKSAALISSVLIAVSAAPLSVFAEDVTDSAHNTTLTAVYTDLNGEYSGKITADDNRDFYKLTLEESGMLTASMFSDNMTGIRYYLYSEDGETELANAYFSRSNNTMQINDEKSYYLSSGTYYIAVSNSNTLAEYYGSYTISFAFESARESFPETAAGDDNTFETANEIELNTPYNGLIAYEDKYDMYKFTVDQKSYVKLSAEAFYSYFDYDIYNSDQVSIASATVLTDSKTQRNLIGRKLTLNPGVYYFSVNSYWYNSFIGKYTFSISTPTHLGDVNNDGVVNAIDASMVLSAYASSSTGGTLGLDDEQIMNADMNGDATVNAVDASSILSYYAYTATGGTQTVEEFIGLR